MSAAYPTEAKRRAARRKAWRENSRRQYDLYRELCDRLGVEGQGRKWTSHLKEIRPVLNPELLRTETCEFKRYWLKRYSLDEIRVMARGL